MRPITDDILDEMAELAGVPVVESERPRKSAPLEEKKGSKQVNDLFYKYFDRVQIDIFAIPKVYTAIEKLLAVRPDAKDLDRAMKDMVKRYAREDVDTDGNPLEEKLSHRGLGADEERLLDEIILTAVNEGAFYKRMDAKGAVKKAIGDIKKYKTSDLNAMCKMVEGHAVNAVLDQWKMEDVDSDGEELTEASYSDGLKLRDQIRRGEMELGLPYADLPSEDSIMDEPRKFNAKLKKVLKLQDQIRDLRDKYEHASAW